MNSEENTIDSQIINDMKDLNLKKSKTLDLGDLDHMKFKKKHLDIKYEDKPEKKLKGTQAQFKEIYDKIAEMRKHKDAPVDKMGAFQNPDPNAPKETQKFQLLVALILSIQTKDETTGAAMENLKKNGLSVDTVYKMDEEDFLKLIQKVNFNKTKAKNIKIIAKKLVEELDYVLPETLQEITKFPGVGPKVGVLYLNHTLGTTLGIGVDTHVHRISNRLGWVKTKAPEETRFALEDFIPKEQWEPINELLVGFGQQICQPINPKCHECLLNKICPEGKKVVKKKNPELKKVKISNLKGKKIGRAKTADLDNEDDGDYSDIGDSDEEKLYANLVKIQESEEHSDQDDEKPQKVKARKVVVARKNSRLEPSAETANSPKHQKLINTRRSSSLRSQKKVYSNEAYEEDAQENEQQNKRRGDEGKKKK